MADTPTFGRDDNRSVLQNAVKQLGLIVTALQDAFPNTTGGTSSSATAGAATLPANPVEFLVITMPDGTLRKVPLYAE